MSHSASQIDLVDDQKVGARDAGAALAGNLYNGDEFSLCDAWPRLKSRIPAGGLEGPTLTPSASWPLVPARGISPLQAPW
jgi:hypothetical protein